MSGSSRTSVSIANLDLINLETVIYIQTDIDPADMISLMFLLYENPQEALEKILLYQQLVEDIGVSSLGLLHEWAARAHTNGSWKWELLEALATCQLYTVIRKLGYHKHTVIELLPKEFEISSYINPMRKIFYKVCENMDITSYRRFKTIVSSTNIHISDHNTCEIVFLELMCQKFFTPVSHPHVFGNVSFGENIKKLLHVLNNIPTCNRLCSELENLDKKNISSNPKMSATTHHLAVPSTSKVFTSEPNQYKFTVQNFDTEYNLINELAENLNLEDLKTDDDSGSNNDGLCYIINQEHFSPSNGYSGHLKLKNRPESTADKILLEKTMKEHHIEVISQDNLSAKEMLDGIRSVVKKYFKISYKVFFLCILSHGFKDHVYSAKYEKVNILDLECLLDSDEAIKLRTIPKVLLVQACQRDELKIEADSSKSYKKRTNMITFSSTAHGYEAYRIIGEGSIFIQSLCEIIQKYSSQEHLTDLFTRVIKDVHHKSNLYGIHQLPIILRNTLTTTIHLNKK